MQPEHLSKTSPIVTVLQALRARHANWHVEIGQPTGRGWITGSALATATEGPFHALLSTMGERLYTSDRRTIAASFALRYSWSCGIVMAPYLLHGCVPKITLDNVSFKFHEGTAFERAALHRPIGAMLLRDGVPEHPYIQVLPDPEALLRYLRTSLVQQAEPVVEALHSWSKFSVRGIWGMITSSWGAQFFNVFAEIEGQDKGLAHIRQLFAGNDLASEMQPDFYPVRYKGITHVYHRRASCCRFYKLPGGQLCASCPIVSQDERLERNQAYMKTLLERH
jgi:ferric iron reductase protein FhuF